MATASSSAPSKASGGRGVYGSGIMIDWAYDHLGLYAWTVEIWSPQRQAGIEEYKFIDWYRDNEDWYDPLVRKS